MEIKNLKLIDYKNNQVTMYWDESRCEDFFIRNNNEEEKKKRIVTFPKSQEFSAKITYIHPDFEKIINPTLYDYIMLHKTIWSLFYGSRDFSKPIEQDVIEIKTDDLEWSEDKTIGYYIWGYPGPDYNSYTIENYMKSWAATKEELIEYWREKENDFDERNEKRDN